MRASVHTRAALAELSSMTLDEIADHLLDIREERDRLSDELSDALAELAEAEARHAS